MFVGVWFTLIGVDQVRPPFSDCDEQGVVEPRVVAAERVAGVDALLARGGDHLARRSSDADGKLLECCLIGKRQFEARLHETTNR